MRNFWFKFFKSTKLTIFLMWLNGVMALENYYVNHNTTQATVSGLLALLMLISAIDDIVKRRNK